MTVRRSVRAGAIVVAVIATTAGSVAAGTTEPPVGGRLGARLCRDHRGARCRRGLRHRARRRTGRRRRAAPGDDPRDWRQRRGSGAARDRRGRCHLGRAIPGDRRRPRRDRPLATWLPRPRRCPPSTPRRVTKRTVRLHPWATENCGWVSATDLGEPSPTPPSRPSARTLDAAAAAEAAGIDVDVTDLDGSADVNLPGFWTKSCSYGNGAMTVSTLSFTAIEDAQQFYADNLDVAAGVVLDVAVGALPESSLVIQTGVAPASAASVPSNGGTVADRRADGAGRRVRGADPVLGGLHRRRRRPGRRGRRRRGGARRPVDRGRTASVRRGDDRLDLPDAGMDRQPRSRGTPGLGDAAQPRAEHRTGRTAG